MIEVCFINFFANNNGPTDILKKKMTPTVCVSSTEANAVLKVKVVYIVSSSNNDYDQILCSETVEGIPAGVAEFDLETEIPDMSKIPREHLIGLTSILFLFYTAENQEFVRVGYFVKIDYPGIQIIEAPAVPAEEEVAFEIDEMESSNPNNEEAKADENKEEKEELAETEDNKPEEKSDNEESIDAEEAEEANEEEIKAEGMHDGILFITEENFKKMDLDLTKLEGQVLDPPLVTVFTEAWMGPDAEKKDVSEEEEEVENVEE
ncbi:histone chaperone ASF1 [Nematocida minor]|uniref:histone chaperone ASF1 n=1 Tax=Nematocida minor TaxID=1912983 RepID=UPI00221F68DD|nr:histone chaperone ASF1 [Nematocida minor]XP_051332057.1 histone chaperone ASF1 [Nematocida minor]KAI5188787.1 histone chaperone ASF1 [Nematocida minor]KAI5188891.1 histone chaperone ASF1 [Nematocida minor]